MKLFEMIFEDDDILVVNKLAPISVQKDKSGDEDLQTLLMREHNPPLQFLEAAHRIDRRTSGITLFAKNQTSLRILEEAFRNRDIQKTYLACLEKEPTPPEGSLIHRLALDPRRNMSIAMPVPAMPRIPKKPGQGSSGIHAVTAELTYRMVLRTERYFFVEAKPLTGRHHQIRAQFSAMGWPIKGDLKYGAKRSTVSGRIMLHGWSMTLSHPATGAALSFTASLPEDETLWVVLAEQFTAQANSIPPQ